MEDLREIEKMGYSLFSADGRIKAVKDDMEIHIKEGSDLFSLRIPIALEPPWGIGTALDLYIEERNINHKGPGVFIKDSGFIWYCVESLAKESILKTVKEMEKTVSRIGPKIIRQMK